MHELSYAGGLITGEGHFGLTVRRTRSGLQVLPLFQIAMTDKDTMDKLEGLFRKMDLPVYRDERHDKVKVQYVIRVQGAKRVRRYCEALIPYLTGTKQRSAQIVLEFIVSRLDRPRGRGVKAPYTESELDLVRQVREQNGQPKLVKNAL